MAIRVAINGFGRIGGLVMRAAFEHKNSDIGVVGINDLGSVATNAHLLKYDSVHGRFSGEVTTGDNWMDAGRGKIRVSPSATRRNCRGASSVSTSRARMHRHLYQARSRGETPRKPAPRRSSSRPRPTAPT